MEWILLLFLLWHTQKISFTATTKRASACYGSERPCDFVRLECKSNELIQILSAQYLFPTKRQCKTSGNIANCTKKKHHGCCDPQNGASPMNFTTDDMKSLINDCSSQPCSSQAPWISNGEETSSSVQVLYVCKNGGNKNDSNDHTNSSDATKNNPAALTNDSDNTAAIVAPIVVVLLIAVIAAGLFLYWYRKRQKKNKSDRLGNDGLHTSKHNATYFDTEKNIDTSQDKRDSDIENTYHTIDPSTIPDHLPFTNDTTNPAPQDEYSMIDPDKIDYEASAAHDYFILEPGQNAGKTAVNDTSDSDYNTLNDSSKAVIKDPNYHRLANIDPKARENHGDVKDYNSHMDVGNIPE